MQPSNAWVDLGGRGPTLEDKDFLPRANWKDIPSENGRLTEDQLRPYFKTMQVWVQEVWAQDDGNHDINSAGSCSNFLEVGTLRGIRSEARGWHTMNGSECEAPLA